MSVLKITGGRTLSGSVRVQGAKNSALPLLAASVLTEGVSVFRNCPKLTDVHTAVQILRHIGCRVYAEGESLYVDASGPLTPDIPDELMREMRSSVIFLGALLSRCGETAVCLPGGCELGPRPVDLHILALRRLGAEITEMNGRLCCKAAKLRGCRIDLPAVSVGATENAMLAAALAEGTTVISGAAREPEIVELQSYLRAAGALVSGAGSSVIRIRGVKKLHGAEHRVRSDRIVTATWLCACASAGGEISLYDAEPGDCGPVLLALKKMGCAVNVGEGFLHIRRQKPLVAPGPIVTRPYPGFPTDAQPPMMAAALKAEGTTVIIETIFSGRYRHIDALREMGADIRTAGKTAVIRGVEALRGAAVTASDLRGGAALLVAALAAEGETVLGGLRHLDRGYEEPEIILRELGADVCRVEETERRRDAANGRDDRAHGREATQTETGAAEMETDPLSAGFGCDIAGSEYFLSNF